MAASPPEPRVPLSVSILDETSSMEKPFDYPDADISLRSSDSRDFRVPKLFIIKSSPVLKKLIQAVSDLPVVALPANTGTPLPVVHMSESGAILHSLLTFILPMPPVLPATVEETIELLSAAKRYKMSHILVHIRGSVALQHPPLICKSNALHVYSLAQKYGLRSEVVQAARLTLKSTLTIESLEGKLDVMHGDQLHILWRYHQNFQGKLVRKMNRFRGSDAYGVLNGLKCVALTLSGIPKWIDDYLCFMAWNPSSFNLFYFQSALARHVGAADDGTQRKRCSFCTCLPEESIDKFWAALTTFVEEIMELVSKAHVFHLI